MASVQVSALVGRSQESSQMSKVCVPGGQVPLRTLLLTSRYPADQRKRGFGAWRTWRLCRSTPRHIASGRQLTRGRTTTSDPTPAVLEPSPTHDEFGPDLNLPGRASPELHSVDESIHCIRRGSGKPRLVYPGARLAREEASTPVAMS